MNDPLPLTHATPRHSLPVLFPGQAQKEFTVNDALARIDALLYPVVTGTVTTPPGQPEAGLCVLVGDNATGAFAGQDGKLASFDGQQWTFLAPVVGMRAVDASAGGIWYFDQEWRRASSPALPDGGSTVDAQARQAIADLTDALRLAGVIS